MPKYTSETFAEAFRPAFEKASATLGVPWRMIAAQAALESANGNSDLSRKDNNYFGITAGSWLNKGKPVVNYPTKEQNPDGTWRVEKRWFRKFSSMDDCIENYCYVLSLDCYKAALARGREGDAPGFFEGLRKGGYASDHKYFELLTARYAQINKTEGLA